MAGHSKWANIKHRKSRQDAKKGKVFAKLIRQITIAAKDGANEKDNPKLRTAVEKALAANMARDVINRAIEKSNKDAETLEEIVYEGYAPGGIAFLVDVLTNNRNRAASEIRHAFTKCGGSLGSSGSVAYLFQCVGFLIVSAESDEEVLFEQAIEQGADDMSTTETGDFCITTSFDCLYTVQDALVSAGFNLLESDMDMVADTHIQITEEKHREQIMRLYDMLDNLEDVQNIYNNADIDSALFAE